MFHERREHRQVIAGRLHHEQDRHGEHETGTGPVTEPVIFKLGIGDLAQRKPVC